MILPFSPQGWSILGGALLNPCVASLPVLCGLAESMLGTVGDGAGVGWSKLSRHECKSRRCSEGCGVHASYCPSGEPGHQGRLGPQGAAWQVTHSPDWLEPWKAEWWALGGVGEKPLW